MVRGTEYHQPSVSMDAKHADVESDYILGGIGRLPSHFWLVDESDKIQTELLIFLCDVVEPSGFISSGGIPSLEPKDEITLLSKLPPAQK